MYSLFILAPAGILKFHNFKVSLCYLKLLGVMRRSKKRGRTIWGTKINSKKKTNLVSYLICFSWNNESPHIRLPRLLVWIGNKGAIVCGFQKYKRTYVNVRTIFREECTLGKNMGKFHMIKFFKTLTFFK